MLLFQFVAWRVWRYQRASSSFNLKLIFPVFDEEITFEPIKEFDGKLWIAKTWKMHESIGTDQSEWVQLSCVQMEVEENY
jgi:hypothetical protein